MCFLLSLVSERVCAGAQFFGSGAVYRELRSTRGFLVVGLKHLDYSIAGRNTRACICYIRSDSDFAFCAGSRFFSRGRESEIEGRWRQHVSSEITASKSAIVHLVCVIIMYTLYGIYKYVASSRSLYAIFLECRGRVCCCW